MGVEDNNFAYGCPNVPVPLEENIALCALCLLNYFGIFVKNKFTLYMKVYFWTLLCFLD